MVLTNSSNALNFQEVSRSFLPKFDTRMPVDRKDNRIVGGTAALVFQGFAIRSNINQTTGEAFSRQALVFGCLGVDGKFRNIPTLCNESLLSLAFDKMGLEIPKIEKNNPLAHIPGMNGFDGLYEIDTEKLYELVYPLRGLLYTGHMNQNRSSRGVYYFSLDFDSLKPIVVAGEHKRLQAPETTTPEKTDFDLED